MSTSVALSSDEMAAVLVESALYSYLYSYGVAGVTVRAVCSSCEVDAVTVEAAISSYEAAAQNKIL